MNVGEVVGNRPDILLSGLKYVLSDRECEWGFHDKDCKTGKQVCYTMVWPIFISCLEVTY